MTYTIDLDRRRAPVCLSDLALDRLRLGEFEGSAEGARAAGHLRTCIDCRGRLAELKAVVAPTDDFSSVPSPSACAHHRWLRPMAWSVPVLAAAAIALLLPWWHEDGGRTKGGGWQLGVIAQYPNGQVAGVFPGATLAPGDRLRFEVSAPKRGYVAVISADAAGAVMPFAPAWNDTVEVPAGRHLLDGAVRLDDSIGAERLLLVACDHPMAVTDVVAAARAALARAGGRVERMPTLALPCSESSFWIRKETRP
jgi:hypothetical protein